jgi:hypothetical protein
MRRFLAIPVLLLLSFQGCSRTECCPAGFSFEGFDAQGQAVCLEGAGTGRRVSDDERCYSTGCG